MSSRVFSSRHQGSPPLQALLRRRPEQRDGGIAADDDRVVSDDSDLVKICEKLWSNKKHRKNNTSNSLVSEWASLPKDILVFILDKLLEPIDHVRLAVVCKQWHSVSEEYNHATQRWCKVLPMLMVPFLGRTKRMVYSISEGKVYTNVQLPVPYDRRCSGSSHGWLATADENFAITLINPFTKVLPIILPRLEFIPSHYERHSIECKKQYEYYVPKVILSANPCLNPENYVVVAIYDFCYRLTFIKAGQQSWTYIKDTVGLFDVVFYNNQIYAVKNGGEIVSLDVNSSNDPSRPPKVNEVTAPLPLYKHHFSCRADMAYLVESTSGDLLHVRRFFTQKEGMGINDSFAVYKLVFNEDDGSIVKQLEVQSIGDDALFLGDNHSISISASLFPRCQQNSIYYTNDTIYTQKRGMGIFNLADKTVTQHYPLNPSERYIPRAIWIVPPFNGLC